MLIFLFVFDEFVSLFILRLRIFFDDVRGWIIAFNNITAWYIIIGKIIIKYFWKTFTFVDFKAFISYKGLRVLKLCERVFYIDEFVIQIFVDVNPKDSKGKTYDYSTFYFGVMM